MSARNFLATWDRAERWALVALQPGTLPPAADFARYMEAVAGLEAVRLDPRDPAPRNNRAEVLRQLGCSTLARREIEVARVLAAGGPLSASVEATARAIAAQANGDAASCPAD